MTRNTFLIVILSTLMVSCHPDITWQEKLGSTLDEFGHRNWIVIADYAYPCQSSEGIETVFTGQDHLEVLGFVMQQIEQAPHIRPKIMIDRELEYLREEDAPGINDYKADLAGTLENREVSNLPHEEIISKLDASAGLFRVLILKTDMILPYTSVFIELDCGYWGAEQEQRLRETMTGEKAE